MRCRATRPGFLHSFSPIPFSKSAAPWRSPCVILGDHAGYRMLLGKLLQASKSKRKIELLSKHQNSMRAVILPAQKTQRRSPRLKFVERFVHFQGAASTKLVDLLGRQSSSANFVESHPP